MLVAVPHPCNNEHTHAQSRQQRQGLDEFVPTPLPHMVRRCSIYRQVWRNWMIP